MHVTITVLNNNIAKRLPVVQGKGRREVWQADTANFSSQSFEGDNLEGVMAIDPDPTLLTYTSQEAKQHQLTAIDASRPSAVSLGWAVTAAQLHEFAQYA